MRALVVEDDPRIAADLDRALTGSGFRVETVADGDSAWFRGGTENYDLIVLDLNLPRLDGLSVLTALRARGRTTPVLVVSALGQVDDVARLRRARVRPVARDGDLALRLVELSHVCSGRARRGRA